ncbi:MAG: nucleotidyltransferase [Candidatus Aminicenantes bacterium]|nr:nucleotidyltransferase [Candidatus Aminicenantes bacterium]
MFQRLLKKIGSGLDKYHIPYMVIGGQAVLLYGEPRLTKDIDITLGIGVDRLGDMRGLVDRLSLKYLTADVEAFVRDTMVLPVIEEKSGIRVDFIFSFSPYEKQAIERARDIPFGKTAVKFAALEDVIIHKMIAGRPRDIEDVQSVLLKNPRYDSHYIEKWLAEFDAALEKKYLEIFADLQKKLK